MRIDQRIAMAEVNALTIYNCSAINNLPAGLVQWVKLISALRNTLTKSNYALSSALGDYKLQDGLYLTSLLYCLRHFGNLLNYSLFS